MSFVLPSFFKIRVVALVLGFFVLFFFVGFARWCFAFPTVGDLISVNDSVYLEVFTINSVFSSGVATDPYCNPPGWFIPQSIIDYSLQSGRDGQIMALYYYDFNPSSGNCVSYYGSVVIHQGSQPSSCPDLDAEIAFLNTCPLTLGTYVCEEPAASTCGLDTCDGITQSDIEAYCSGQGVDVAVGSGNNVTLTCSDNGTEITDFSVDCVDCSLLRASWANANCNGLANLADYDCETDTGTCKNYTCNDLLAQCYEKCGGSVNNFSCTESSSADPSVSVPCECMSTSPDINSGTSADDNPLGQAADTTTPDSATTDPNAKITADNTKLIADSIGKDLPAIDKSIQANGAKLDTINDSLGDIKDELSGLDADLSGTYKKETITNNYSVDPAANTFSQFDTRFGTFVSDLKATPLFSLPNQVLFNIPNSTESSYTINMGQYGQAAIDLADYATPLLILRSAFLLCFSYAGLRIVVSKK